MNYKHRGIALIIDNHTQSKQPTAERAGWRTDVHSLRQTIGDELGFEIVLRTDRSAEAMRADFVEFARDHDHSNSDCFLCVVMSDGHSGAQLGVDARDFNTKEEAETRFNNADCPSLRNKPKMFFIDASRGHRTTQSFRESTQAVAATVTADRQFCRWCRANPTCTSSIRQTTDVGLTRTPIWDRAS